MNKEKEFWFEMTHYLFLATAMSLFVVAFITLGKIALSKLPIDGPAELFAAA
jgi:hypothetical protein